MIISVRQLGVAAALAMTLAPVAAQDAAAGAALYMRLPNDLRSCVSCHGPDPGLSHNNIMRAADNPDAILKALGSATPMQYLSAQLSATDRTDVAAFLGTVARLRSDTTALRMWPVTLDFGNVSASQASGTQRIRLSNASTQTAMPVGDVAASSPALQLTHDCPPALPPLAACEISVRLRPVATGLVRGAVRVDAAHQTQYAGASGSGSSSPSSALEWRATPASLSFSAAANGQPVEKSVVLSNPGPLPAVLGLTSITGPQASQFRIHGGCALGSVLVAGTQCEMVITFVPGGLPAYEAMLQLRSDQANPSAIRLQATTAEAAPEPMSPTPTPEVPSNSGGGCSMAPSDSNRRDPTLVLAIVGAALLLVRRRKNGQCSWSRH